MTCKCVSCGECGGSGSIWISFTGKYRGKYRRDDLDERDTCPECGGEGITELCDECRMRSEEDEENY